jgi:septal ring factor EnvC (AmiA/AmiB activator)
MKLNLSFALPSLRSALMLLLCGGVWFQPSVAQPTVKQKKEQLQTQMQKLQDEIKVIQQAIKANTVKKDKSLSEVLSLQAKIQSREKLIGNIANQVSDLDASIDHTQEEIDTKTVEVDKLKIEYAKMLRKSYENISLQNQIAFMLSSTSFSEAARRYNYLLKIAEYRSNQAKQIQVKVDALQAKKDELMVTKGQKETMLEKQNAQKQELEAEKKQKDQAVAVLLDKDKKLRQRQVEKNKAVAQLNNRIQAIIEDEIRQARKKAEELAKKAGTAKPSTTTTPTTAGAKKVDAMPMTPEEQALAKDFLSNRGKLPWPVAKGHIVSQFGKHEHPVLKGVVIENNGIDIKTEKGASARALFSGTVVSVFYLPTTHNCVIVKHGDYFTVYSNLETVSVATNQDISTKQTLGKLYSDKAEDLTKVHVEIWKGKEKMDPKLWLAN